MGTIFVARSIGLGQWASDVGQSKHVFKVGWTEAPVKEVIAAGWAGLTDWALLKKQDGVDGVTEEQIIERLAARVRMLDPSLYPRLKGTTGIYNMSPTLHQGITENPFFIATIAGGQAKVVQ